MNNYIIIGIVICIVSLLIFNSDLLKLDFLNFEIRRRKKMKKIDMSESYVDYDSDSKSESNNYKKKKNIDDTEISFDDSSDKSKIINNKNTNKKLLSNIKKLMIDMKNNKNSKNNREDINSKEDRNKIKDRNGRTDNKKSNNIQEMHKLAQQLSKKNNSQQINQQSDNTNYDLTDTISGIINNELNNA
jgi:hypothetical protein